METRQQILLAILIVAGGYLIFDTFIRSDDNGRPETKTAVTAPAKKTKSPPTKGKATKTAVASTNAGKWFPDFSQNSWGRDPFFYPSREKQVEINTGEKSNVVENLAGERYQLTGISRRGNDAFVIINNEVLKVGDVLDGARLLEIHSNSVVMENNGEKFVVALSKTG